MPYQLPEEGTYTGKITFQGWGGYDRNGDPIYELGVSLTGREDEGTLAVTPLDNPYPRVLRLFFGENALKRTVKFLASLGFTAKDIGDLDKFPLVGKPVWVSLTHDEWNGKPIANINPVTRSQPSEAKSNKARNIIGEAFASAMEDEAPEPVGY